MTSPSRRLVTDCTPFASEEGGGRWSSGVVDRRGFVRPPYAPREVPLPSPLHGDMVCFVHFTLCLPSTKPESQHRDTGTLGPT